MPALATQGLWPAQVQAIRNLETSFAEDRPRALIQMATGSGKTFTAVNAIYRLIQRLYFMLQGEPDLDPEAEEPSLFDTTLGSSTSQAPVAYNPSIPIETFDVIFTDECHRSIYNLWRQVLEYFDAFLVGLTATPSKQTLGFFNKNLVMEYGHEDAVADGVNVDFDVYRILTEISQRGSRVEAGMSVDKRDRLTRERRWEQLDDALVYAAPVLVREVVAEDQIRTALRSFKERIFTEIFPGRTEVPKSGSGMKAWRTRRTSRIRTSSRERSSKTCAPPWNNSRPSRWT
ncbi:DEAD/DEAH box helicase family protein [Corallococcus sicarius]|uniref:DEAD/DEAH box helicase family protein n=1 Tax=Corallococcus sicarius TaxID=2316726 RepID=UPI001ABF31A4|nr:DEAD/DEAH box helicase family protein [Corallococcus sicarius]